MSPPVVTVVIPLKSIGASKTRMAPTLSPADRALLLSRTFDRVVTAAGEARSVSDVVVVAGDAEGRSWAADHGLGTIADPGQGLNAALRTADAYLGTTPTLVLPADLPLVTPEDVNTVIDAVSDTPGVVVAPTSDGGTGGLVRVPGPVIPPLFGPGSAAAHAEAARRVGVACATLVVPGLALDLDRPADIEKAGGWPAVGATGQGRT